MKLTATTTIRYSELTPRSLAAVNDLNSIIEKIIGKKLVVISGHTGAIPANTLFIGFIPDAKNQFQHIDWSFEQNEMVIIACRNNIAVISGRDKEAVTSTVIGGNGKPINDVQEEYGTVNAIYTFVFEYLGVRFFYDEPGGAYYPDKTDVFKIPNKRIIHAPSIRDRSPMHLLRFKANFPKYAAGRQWALRNRILCNSLDINPNHNFKDYPVKVFSACCELVCHPQILFKFGNYFTGVIVCGFGGTVAACILLLHDDAPDGLNALPIFAHNTHGRTVAFFIEIGHGFLVFQAGVPA